MTLFVKQDFVSHSGLNLHWKIDCDGLTWDDVKCLAFMLSEVLLPFGKVVGIPIGGVHIADALASYITPSSRRILVVDDVLTTGRSMEAYRSDLCNEEGYSSVDVIGAVLFNRNSWCPSWITPLFSLTVMR